MFPAFAAEPALLDGSLTIKNISNHIEYIEDAKKKLTIRDVARNKKLKWTQSASSFINFGYTKSQYWFRFTANNSTPKTLSWILEIDFPPIDLIELYVPDDEDGFVLKKTGDMLPFSSRDFNDVNYLFKMNQKPGPLTCYFRIDSLDSINFNLNMLSLNAYLDRLHVDLALYWAYFGLMLVIGLYSLSFFVLTRDRENLYFGLLVIFFMLFEFNFKGFGSQYLWPNAVWWNSHANAVLVCLLQMLSGLFLVEFVDLKSMYPRICRLVLISITASPSVMAVVSLLTDVQTGLLIIYAGTLLMVSITIAFGIFLAIIKKPPSRQARIALAAFSLYGISIPILTFTMLGMLPANFFTRWVLQLGSSVTFVTLAIGIADKVNTMKGIIQKTELRYSHLIESTNEMIFTLDEKNSIMSMNNAVHEHLGFSIEEVLNTNLMDLIYESSDKNFTIAKLLVLEHISDLRNKIKRNVRFRTTMKARYSHEPVELTVNLEYTGDKNTGYTILGKASPVIDDTLVQFLVSERYAYSMNNYLGNAELMSQRLVRNLHKYADAATVSEIRIALREAIINAIEHGNLNLTFEEKTESQMKGDYFKLIGERQMDPSFTEKRVFIEYSLNEDRVAYKIADEGEGFDHRSLLDADPDDPENVALTHGRGLFMITTVFDSVRFNNKGNQMLLIKYFDNSKTDYL